MNEILKETIICCSCKKKFKTPKERKEEKGKKEDNKSKLYSEKKNDKLKEIDNNAQNTKINPKFIHRKFKCPYCRTLNVIVEEVSTDKNKKDKNDNSDKKNPKVSVTIYETTASGPTLDYLREHGMPAWIKDN